MATEMQTKQQADTSPDAGPPSDLDPNALAAIRELLHTEATEPVQPAPERQTEAPAQAVPVAPVAPRRTRSAAAPLEAPAVSPKGQPQQEAFADLPNEPVRRAAAPGLKARIMSYRPTPKHMILFSIALLVLFRPWLVIGLFFLSLFVMVGVFLILGYDGFWRRAMGLARWYAQRRPSRAAELHQKLDAFAMKWDAVLDRFPEGSVDGLYLPDFGELEAAESRHDAALERRFSDLREGGA
ncbi:hypothetical protein Z946_688 [Sulfitobacter noctilucicola]|uniref:Uncharacterized protein n=1 Tax=Sulfitobacter noctilucicola TaxID=1342301 RepID=A0A7W6Q4V2_9RHOB|nr:hypothetical protein [Sulfitobacter noctilucicola]KIN65965.1 hypothetical protein Z946_688 [Sulfitobacter noctilucicola]MBB4173197.1 hypothetical protein [Sulfitobacter noctilucicola]